MSQAIIKDMIYIVIPVFNRLEYTKLCLDALMDQSDKDFVTIVVDHGSTDGTRDYLPLNYPDIQIVYGDKSMWWTAATNLGIRHALNKDARYVLTLNNDTVPEADYIAELKIAIKSAPIGSIIGSTAIDHETKEVLYRGERVKWFYATNILIHKSDVTPINGVIEVTHFPGRGMLIPSTVFNKIGLFDEKTFPHYMADYDFTLKARRNNIKVFCAWNAKIGVFLDASGANQLKSNKSFRSYWQHLFGIKGGANLPLFIKYTFRNCPFYAIPSHLVLGATRRVLGYWLKKN